MRRHRLGAAAIACTALAATLVPAASGSELIARNATNVRVQADAQGRALVSFRSEGQSRQLLAWGAIDARFVQLLDDGTEVVLDRLKLLKKAYEKQSRKKRAQNNVWILKEKLGAEVDVAKQLCGVLGPQAKIKIYSRISKPHIGWAPRLNGKIVNCSEQ